MQIMIVWTGIIMDNLASNYYFFHSHFNGTEQGTISINTPSNLSFHSQHHHTSVNSWATSDNRRKREWTSSKDNLVFQNSPFPNGMTLGSSPTSSRTVLLDRSPSISTSSPPPLSSFLMLPNSRSPPTPFHSPLEIPPRFSLLSSLDTLL